MNKIFKKLRALIKSDSELNKPEINTTEIKSNKVRRNKWGYPIFVKSNAISLVKKVR